MMLRTSFGNRWKRFFRVHRESAKMIALTLSIGMLSVVAVGTYLIAARPNAKTHSLTPNVSLLYNAMANELSGLEGIGGVEYRIPDFLLAEYKICEGENITYVANKTGISVDTLVSVNKLDNAHRLIPGKTIMVPNRNGLLCTVQEGQTLETFSEKYGVEVDKIRAVNKLRGEAHEGDELFIPGARFTGSERLEKLGMVFACPLERYRVSSTFGYRRDPFTQRRTLHKGVDMAYYKGAVIYAAKDGRVTFAGTRGGYGNTVVMAHEGSYQTLYAHMDSIRVKSGTYIKRGTPVGTVGNSGRSTGAHLHFEVHHKGRLVDPMSVMAQR